MHGFTQIWENLPSRFDASQSLPLHICDIVPWIGAAALLFSIRSLRSLAYFWGIGLSVWALITPILSVGPAHLRYWLFWLGHGQIIGTAAYLVVVLKYRPRMRDLGVVAIATIVYVLAVLPVDFLFDADYGYVGRQSPTAPLGPWPARVLIVLLAECLIFVLLILPWQGLHWRAKRKVPKTSS